MLTYHYVPWIEALCSFIVYLIAHKLFFILLVMFDLVLVY